MTTIKHVIKNSTSGIDITFIVKVKKTKHDYTLHP